MGDQSFYKSDAGGRFEVYANGRLVSGQLVGGRDYRSAIDANDGGTIVGEEETSERP